MFERRRLRSKEAASIRIVATLGADFRRGTRGTGVRPSLGRRVDRDRRNAGGRGVGDAEGHENRWRLCDHCEARRRPGRHTGSRARHRRSSWTATASPTSARLTTPDGTLVITYSGIVSGDKFTGTVDLGGLGQAPYNGVRVSGG